MGLRAFWTQESTNGVVDRIEIHDSQFSGDAFQFEGDETGFSFSHSEITSESTAKLLNVHANPIQKGRLDFRPRIASSEGFSLLEDIRDATDGRRFHIVHKEDGSLAWCGYITSKVFQYPERDNNFVSHVRAIDFEWMEGDDYTLDDTRQTLIQTIADLLSGLPEDVKIKTATSWITEQTTDSIDFLGQVFHETKALRAFGKTDEEIDQPIKVWDALHHMAEPGLLIRQHKGFVFIDQLTELDDPSSVHETIYNADGSVDTATTTVDRRQTGYKSTEDGTPSIKVSSQNHTYPAIKQATATYDHRTKVTNIQPTGVRLTDDAGETSYSDSQLFLSDGSQRIEFSIFVFGSRDGPLPEAIGQYYLKAGPYYWDDGEYEWTTNGGNILWNEYDLTNTTSKPELSIWLGGVGFETDQTPPDADGELEFQVDIPTGLTQSDINIQMDITNPIASENSTSINYQLTQTHDYPSVFELEDTWFGDGPVSWTVGALRHGTDNSDTTTDDWQRRGSSSYRNYHENLLKEILDLQRTPSRKIQANIYGDYDPSKVLVYDGSHFYYAGGNYDGTIGRWTVTLFEINIQTASDDFDDIPKFSGDTDSGTGASSNDPTTGNFNPSTYDKRWFNIQNDLAEGTPSTMRSNLGLVIGTDVQAWDATLQDLSDDLTATASELNRLDGDLATVQGNLGLKDGSAELDLASLDVDDINIDGNTIKAQNGQNLVLDGNGNDVLVHGDTIKIDKEMTTTDNIIVLNDGEVGSGITAGSAGAQFDRGTEPDYQILFQESNKLFSIGEVGFLQAVATRPDSPDDTGLGIWNESESWYETSSDLTFDGSVLDGSSIDAEFENIDIANRITVFSNIEHRDDNIESGDLTAFTNWVPSDSLYRIAHFGGTNRTAYDIQIGRDGGTARGTISLAWGDVDIPYGTLTGVDASLSSTLDVGGHVGSPDFASQTTDWRVTKAGAADFREVYSDEIHTQAFVAEVNEALVGAQVIGTSRAKLSRNFSVPSDGNTETLFVEDLEGFEGSQVFSAGDWVLLQMMDRSGGGLTVAEVWGKVTSYSDLSGGEQSWTFTTEDDGGVSGSTVFAGSIAVDYGQSGDGVIRSTVLDSQGAPYTQIETWTTDPSVASNFTAKTRVGILDGITNASGAGLYGENTFLTGLLLAGDLTETDNFMKYDSGTLTVDGSIVVQGGSGIGNFSDSGALAELDTVSSSEIDDATIEKAKLGTTVISGGFLVTDLIEAGSIVASKIATDTLTANEIAADTITASEIAAGTITASEIDANTITATEIAAGTITANEINVSDLYSEDATISGVLTVGSSHKLDGTSDEVSFAGGILTANASEVGLASFTADSDGLSNGDIFIGDNLQDQTEKLRIGIWDTGSKEYPYIRMADNAGTVRVRIASREGVGNDFVGVAVFDASGNTLASMGSENILAGMEFDSGSLVTGDGNLNDGYTAGTVTGMQPREDADTRVLFGGADNEDGDGASFYATADGRLFYDAMTQVIYSRTEIADLDTINPDGASPIGDSSWNMSVDDGGGGGANNPTQVVQAGYVHRAGLNKIEVSGFYDFSSTINDEGEASLRVFVSIGVASTGQQTIRSETTDVTVSGVPFHEVFDISSFELNNNEAYTVRCIIVLEADLASGDNVFLTSSIHEDVVILATT